MPSVELHAIFQLVLATLLGACIGVERSIAGKRAGMRTYALVSLGSCLLTVTSLIISNSYIGLTSFDPLRIAASIVMGIGFIGTGVVVFKGDSLIGLTTAAGLWVVSAVGIAIGFRLYTLSVAATVLTIVILGLFISIENGIARMFRDKHEEDIHLE